MLALLRTLLALMVLAQCWAAEAPEQTPTPGKTDLPLPPGTSMEKTASERFRENFTEPPPCKAIPPSLFHAAPGPLAERIPNQARLAGAGRFLAALFQDPSGGFTVRLFRDQKPFQELFLRPRHSLDPGAPLRLVISRDGGYLALFGPGFFDVFAGGSELAWRQSPEVHAPRLAFGRGELLWCDGAAPGAKPSAGEKPVPLCYRAELDGSSQEAILFLDEVARTLDEDATLDDYQFVVAPRANGKLWFANLMTGEVLLASASGRKTSRWVLPYAFQLDRTALAEMLKWFSPRMEQAVAKAAAKAADATKPPKPLRGKLTARLNLIADVGARVNDLVLLTSASWKPANALFWISSDLAQVRCFLMDELQEKLATSSGLKKATHVEVTDDALWLREPFGYILWQDLLALEEPGERGAPGEAPPPPGQ